MGRNFIRAAFVVAVASAGFAVLIPAATADDRGPMSTDGFIAVVAPEDRGPWGTDGAFDGS